MGQSQNRWTILESFFDTNSNKYIPWNWHCTSSKLNFFEKFHYLSGLLLGLGLKPIFGVCPSSPSINFEHQNRFQLECLTMACMPKNTIYTEELPLLILDFSTCGPSIWWPNCVWRFPAGFPDWKPIAFLLVAYKWMAKWNTVWSKEWQRKDAFHG